MRRTAACQRNSQGCARFFRKRPEAVEAELLYEYITLRSERYSVQAMCRVLKVSESGYYRWLKRTHHPQLWKLLLVQIQRIFALHPDNDNYGIRRIWLALTQEGTEVSLSTVSRTMKKGNLLKAARRRSNGLTKADATTQKAENLIRRDFSAEAPNRKWLIDITQILCSDGKLYIAPVLGCYNGNIVGLAMDNNMKRNLCIRAFESACRSRDTSGMILHSDRGSRFTSQEFRKTLVNTARFRA